MSDLNKRYDEANKLIDDEKYAEAIPLLKQIVEEDDTYVLAHLALARACTKTGEHDVAIAHGERVVELEPTDSFNFTALSVTYQQAWAGTQKQEYITKAEDAMARAHQIAQGG